MAIGVQHVWEISSVNHRYLEISLRLPEPLRELESQIREQIAQVFNAWQDRCVFKIHGWLPFQVN